MSRDLFLDLTERGARVPIGTDLVLQEKADVEAVLLDGVRLGQVVVEAAERYHTPLAFHLMDLMVEKAAMLDMLALASGHAADSYHFNDVPTDDMLARLDQALRGPLTPRMQANIDAVAYVAKNTSLIPIGMTIGPFSLMTKLLADPITPVYMAGSGLSGRDDPEIRMVERTIEMAERIVVRSVEAQIQAGARAILVAEPAANKAYFSPNQLQAGSDIFERYVMAHQRRLKQRLDSSGVELIFHCCGELVDEMVRQFASLDPVMLSLGSSRKLWEDARLVPNTTILYGNLPTRKFFSDELLSIDQVRALTCDLIARMRATGHHFILGSECDVLHVPGCENAIRAKVDVMLDCPCD